jgi:competence protein ComEC
VSADRWSWIDLRLVPAAVTVWALTLVAPGWAPAPLIVTGVACAVAGVLLLRGSTGAPPRQRAARTVAVGCLAAATVVTVATAVRAAERADSPLRRLAAEGTVTAVVLRVDEPPRPLTGAVAPRVLVAATVREAAGRPVGSGAVLVFGPEEQWQGSLPGQVVRMRAAFGPARAGDEVLAVLSARSAPVLVSGPGRVQAGAGVLRAGLAGSAARTLPPRPAGLLPGLVVGDTRAMDPALTTDFRRAGLSHLTAVSGANVAIAIGLVLWPLRRRGAHRWLQSAVGLLALAGFVVLAGPGASVLRAAAMGAVTLLALAGGRSRSAVPALAVAVVVLLVLDPTLARHGGFALSVAATAAIVLLAVPWTRALRQRGVPRLPAEALAVSAAAGLVTAPLVAALSGVVSIVSLPANLLAAPAVAPATVLGLAAAVLSPVLPPLADGLCWLAGWPVRWLVIVAERAAAVPDGATGWPAGVPGAVLLAVLLGAGVWTLVRRPRMRPVALAALLGVLLIGWPVRQAARGWPLADTVVVACDVGQGDALVLPTGPGEGVLVDAGPDAALVDGCLSRLGVDRLPLVLLSHLDADHVGGLAGALAGREVGAVATAALAPTDDRVGALVRLVHRAGSRHVVLQPGDVRTVGDARIEVLAPEPAQAIPSAEPNDLCMVLRASQRGVSVLFTGDLGAEAEQRLVTGGVDLRADVLKVPHHGSADADPDFLAASGARVALVSVGADNPYGHPTGRLLDWLAEADMRVYRTDSDGDLAVVGRAGDWGVAVRGPDAVTRATASGGPGPVLVGRPAGADRRRRAGRSVARDTMGAWQQHPPHRRRTCGSWWGRRSCCVPARSPPSGRRSGRPIRTRRSTNSSPAACPWARWPMCWPRPCSAVTGSSSSPGCTRRPGRWSTRWSATPRTPTPT